MAELTFLGATGEVTGSRYLLTTDQHRVLMDCGLRQGDRQANEFNRRSLKALARDLDAVVLSHAHLDHCGLLPKLVADGYRGDIFCTEGTAELLPIMLRDSANLMLRDLAQENKWRQRRDEAALPAPYDMEDVEQTLGQLKPIRYGEDMAITGDMRVKFHDAGHILGSAIVELFIQDAGRQRHLVFSGDLGNRDVALMHDPARLEHADVVLLESTYGDREHRPLADTLEEFAEILARADREGGNVFIPAFAVGRTQELLYHLGAFHQQGLLPQHKVFVDSPMGIAVTQLYARRHDLLKKADVEAAHAPGNGELMAYLPQLEFTESVQASMGINRVKSGAIVIAGSGMCTGGRITHHFKWNLWRRQAHVVIVGFQARGTLGRRLVDGADSVKIFGQEIAVRAQIHTLGGFSAHAGQSELLSWAQGFTSKPVFHLVHGEDKARDALAAALQDRGIDARIPAYEDTVVI